MRAQWSKATHTVPTCDPPRAGLLPLLDSATVRGSGQGGGADDTIVYMLFPAFTQVRAADPV